MKSLVFVTGWECPLSNIIVEILESIGYHIFRETSNQNLDFGSSEGIQQLRNAYLGSAVCLQQYLARIQNAVSAHPHCVIKSRYLILIAPQLRKIYPDAVIIAAVENPLFSIQRASDDFTFFARARGLVDSPLGRLDVLDTWYANDVNHIVRSEQFNNDTLLSLYTAVGYTEGRVIPDLMERARSIQFPETDCVDFLKHHHVLVALGYATAPEKYVKISQETEHNLKLMQLHATPNVSFLKEQDYLSVLGSNTFKDGRFCPVPIVLQVPETTLAGDTLVLLNQLGLDVATLDVKEVFVHDSATYASGTLTNSTPKHTSALEQMYRDAVDVRNSLGKRRALAVHFTGVIHQRLYHSILQAMEECGADSLLLFLNVGIPEASFPVDVYTQIQCCNVAVSELKQHKKRVQLIPVPINAAGAKTALWQMAVSAQYGCAMFASTHEESECPINIKLVKLPDLKYVPMYEQYTSSDIIQPDWEVVEYTDDAYYADLRSGRTPHEWFAFATVTSILKQALFKTPVYMHVVGLACSGKTLFSKLLLDSIKSVSNAPVTIVDDGNLIECLNIPTLNTTEETSKSSLRVCVVGCMLLAHGVNVIANSISPTKAILSDIKSRVEAANAKYIQIHINTPLPTCQERDAASAYNNTAKQLLTDVYQPPSASDYVVSDNIADVIKQIRKTYF